MKRELPAGAEKRCFVGSSFLFFLILKNSLLTTNTPIGIQGGNSVKKLEEFLEWGGTKKDITLHAPTRAKSFSSSWCKSIMVKILPKTK